MNISASRFSRSPVRGSVTRVRTSSTAMLGGSSDDAIVRRIRKRISYFSGYPDENIEPLQVVHYEKGQKYDGHHDFFDICDLDDKSSSGRRQVTRHICSSPRPLYTAAHLPAMCQVTFLIYLNNMPPGETGGGTSFPELKLEVQPEQGSAVVFNDCLDNGHEDGRSLHAALPPINPGSVKMAITVWIRSHPVYKRMSAGIL